MEWMTKYFIRSEDEIVEDAPWVACAEWANFEPVVGQPKAHK
jgi:hypothetical protein